MQQQQQHFLQQQQNFHNAQQQMRAQSPFSSARINFTEEDLQAQLANRKKVPKAITEKQYTYDQVKDIVQRVLAEKEAQLRMEYDRILQDRLQEQFQNFAKFNEDYISRHLKDRDCSYLS